MATATKPQTADDRLVTDIANDIRTLLWPRMATTAEKDALSARELAAWKDLTRTEGFRWIDARNAAERQALDWLNAGPPDWKPATCQRVARTMAKTCVRWSKGDADETSRLVRLVCRYWTAPCRPEPDAPNIPPTRSNKSGGQPGNGRTRNHDCSKPPSRRQTRKPGGSQRRQQSPHSVHQPAEGTATAPPEPAEPPCQRQAHDPANCLSESTNPARGAPHDPPGNNPGQRPVPSPDTPPPPLPNGRPQAQHQPSATKPAPGKHPRQRRNVCR